jgi:3-oxoacyl-(acyl-carrier-protein) synthase
VFAGRPAELKVVPLSLTAASEALADSGLDLRSMDRDRVACAVSGHMGDTGWLDEGRRLRSDGPADTVQWYEQWMPNTACSHVANRFGLYGPRLCHSVACASGLVEVLSAVRAIRDGQCDVAVAGSAEFIHPLFVAGFEQMKVLAHHPDPPQACRPFDLNRQGFVIGEGAAMFVLERLTTAERRGARIYSEILGGKLLGEAHHVTGLDMESEGLCRVIVETLKESRLSPRDVQFISAHGTGTHQNDLMETRGIRMAFGKAADDVWVSGSKSMLGHLLNAAGSTELAISALALRDGFVPPTMNLTNPDPACDLDFVPLVGRKRPVEHALKISLAFGGHLVAIVLRRWEDERTVRPGLAA